MPAQQTIPLLVRWMLVLEDSDEDRLYLAKGVPRSWVVSGKDIGMEGAPTRWGRASFSLCAKHAANTVVGHVNLTGTRIPKEVHFKFRLPQNQSLKSVMVNGRPASLGGIRNDTVIIVTENKRTFDVIGRLI